MSTSFFNTIEFMDNALYEQNILIEKGDPTDEFLLNDDLIDPFVNSSTLKNGNEG